MHIRLAPRHLVGRVVLLVIGIAVVQFAVTILLYDRISRDSVREDHARRVAELLEVSERLAERSEPGLAAIMSTRHLHVWLTPRPAVPRHSEHEAVRQITTLIRQWEPALGSAPLRMGVEHGQGREHLVGSMRLRGGGWLNFRSYNLSNPWPIIVSASLISLVTAGFCVLLAVLTLRQLAAPLRRLTEAAAHIGEGAPVRLAEEGPSDLRDLAHAFNAMQERIARILSDQARSLVAISHDLRTPLARLSMATDYLEPADMRDLVGDNVGEMNAMIESLQAFLAVQDVADRPERTELSAILDQAAAPWRDHVRLPPPSGLMVVTYPEVLRRALEPLIENAVQYGGTAHVALEGSSAAPTPSPMIVIRDDGPGIDDAHFANLVEPFFRVDAARARNTPGFGLGIPRAHRLLRRFGGDVSFRSGPAGGLEVVVQPPRPLAD